MEGRCERCVRLKTSCRYGARATRSIRKSTPPEPAGILNVSEDLHAEIVDDDWMFSPSTELDFSETGGELSDA